MGQRSVPAPFLTKTYQLVDDQSTDDVISWGENGTTFVVWRTAEFAKDLLPNYFKHNNFSSFVRQLNTYGFRKIVPDKWEFANDNFKRGEKSLLSKIRRRKTTTLTTSTGKIPVGNNPSQSMSGDDVGSTSTSSQGTIEIADLSCENEKLRRDNEMLSSELALTKKQCDELVAFLTRNLNVGPDQIDRILRGPHVDVDGEMVVGDMYDDDDDDDKDNDNQESEEEVSEDSVKEKKKIEEEGLKLFGVWLKEVEGKKRGRCCDEFHGDTNNNGHNLGLSGPDCGRKVMRTR